MKHNLYTFDMASFESKLLFKEPMTERAGLKFNDDQGLVAELYVENNQLKFEGHLDHSALLFVKHINIQLDKLKELAEMSGELKERNRILDVIDDWVEDSMPLITDLVNKIKHPKV